MTDKCDALQSKLDPPDRPRAREDVVFRRLEDEWILFDPSSQNMHVLNATAGVIWLHMDGTNTLEQLVGHTRAAFDPPAPLEVVHDDVVQTLEQFASKGLLA